MPRFDDTHASNSPNSVRERVVLKGTEDVVRFTFGENVVISLAETIKPERDCSRVRTQVMCEFKGTRRIASGNLMAAREMYVAYRNVPIEGPVDGVRIMDLKTNQRFNIKEFESQCSDIAWAPNAPVLAIADILGNLYLYEVLDPFEVKKIGTIVAGKQMWSSPRIKWCPFVPDSNDPQRSELLLLIYQGSFAAMFNVHTLKSFGPKFTKTYSEIRSQKDAVYEFFIEEGTAILDACISPDTSALAFVLQNDSVQFFVLDEKPKMMTPKSSRHDSKITLFEYQSDRRWHHDISSMSQLLFLDALDHQNGANKDQLFWKYAIAVSNEGHRLDIINCDTWSVTARARLDSPFQSAPFLVYVDKLAKNAIVVDAAGANILCLEIDYSKDVPKWGAITQIYFCHPLITAVPFDVTDGSKDDNNGNLGVNQIMIHMCGINYKNVAQLEVTLDRVTDPYSPVSPTITNGLLMTTTTNVAPGIESKLDALTEQVEQLSLKVSAGDCGSLSADFAEMSSAIKLMRDEISVSNKLIFDCLNDLLFKSKKSEDSAAQISAHVSAIVNKELIPILDNTLTQLFQQLNEHFRDGIEDYLKQIHSLQKSVTASHDSHSTQSENNTSDSIHMYRTKFNKCVEQKQFFQAIEIAALLLEPELILYICKIANSEDIFANTDINISPYVAVQIIKALTLNLSDNTELKLSYIEQFFSRFSVHDPEISAAIRPTLFTFADELRKLETTITDRNLKRRAQLLAQLIGLILNGK